ncbi:MAG: PaaI family thioesterase [Acidimicrobiales bacterium]|nr:PaaI family thioesterase [Acidimicrobiales bacterium]
MSREQRQERDQADEPGLRLVGHIGTELLRHEDGSVTSWCALRPDLADATGALLPGCLAFIVDGSGGLVTGLAAVPEWVVTSDLDLRLVGRVTVGPARTEARVVRRGRGTVTAEIMVFDEGDDDRAVGVATLTSAVLTPDFEAPGAAYPVGRRVGHGTPDIDATPIREWLGLETTAGGASLALRPEICNPWGILHGGATCLLAEAAAEAVVGGPPGSLRDLLVRFVAPARVGPIVAQASVIGRRPDDTVVQIEVRDVGADGRLTALATASVGALSPT